MTPIKLSALACPLPQRLYQNIVMGHGSGGRMSADLIKNTFLPAFSNEILNSLEDQATLDIGGSRIAFTTDSYVVNPIFFPGGDIGRLAINGTINDLAVGGAIPRYIAAAFILEEGFSIDELQVIVESMRSACEATGVKLVTGDTKVVDRGKGDKVYISTTGIGEIPEGINLSASAVVPGDSVIVSGTLGDHGMAIMSVREGLEFETTLESDTAPLSDLTRKMLEACPTIRCMRDPTRGGLASTLNEISAASKVGIQIRETDLPIRKEVSAACELLGLDALYVANEGKLVAVVPAADAARLLSVMRSHPLGQNAAIIGTAVDNRAGMVTMISTVGGERIVGMLGGEQLPRIC